MLHRIFKLSVVFFFIASFLTGSIFASGELISAKKKIVKKTLHHKKHSKKKHTKAIIKIHSINNNPPPGSSGEERNYAWYAKRAFPNEEIDPSYYAIALEQSKRLPFFKPYGKNTQQSTMQWHQIGPYSVGGRVTAIAT